MRLLHTQSLTLKDFAEGKIPKYAILSHTWEEEREVLYQDFGPEKTPSSKAGWNKISGLCSKAREDDLDWAWVDTCCIDKSSSTELSEAINSMYRWYQNAEVCYVYLTDVTAGNAAEGSEASEPDDEAGKKPLYHFSAFTRSRWFKRGWTLQELISPRHVEFFTLEWRHIGRRDNLTDRLKDKTDIPGEVLEGHVSPQRSSVAQRMAWAAGRETTRREDEAYCLLGLFGVHMPLLYGEGLAAFQRLQRQIVMLEEDYSLLVWTDDVRNLARRGCLAPQPGSFQKLYITPLSPADGIRGDIDGLRLGAVPDPDGELSPYLWDHHVGYSVEQSIVTRSLIPKDHQHEARPPEMTSRGLRISLFIRSTVGPVRQCFAWTYCQLWDELLCIMLERLDTVHGTVYKRTMEHRLFTIPKWFLGEFSRREIYLAARELPDDVYSTSGYDCLAWGQRPDLLY